MKRTFNVLFAAARLGFGVDITNELEIEKS
jgi:hypothetical protein